MPHVTIDDVDFFYELSGPEGAPLVVFAEPLGATLDIWEWQVAALRGRYRCLRYDVRGRGGSPTDDRPAGSVDLADDLHGLLDALGLGRIHLFGLGGATAQAFAIRHPERLHSLVLMSCEPISDISLGPGPASIAVPTLLITAHDDPATRPAAAEDMRRLIPRAEMIIVPHAADRLASEHSGMVYPYILAFLDRHRGPLSAGEVVDFKSGLENRKAVLGPEHVERSLRSAGPFAMPWQDFITRYAWGEIWGDPALPWKTRSLVTLAIMIALHREEEFKLHLRPALRNGVTADELRALFKQGAVYAGVPAANGAFRWAKEELGAAFGDETGQEN